MCPFENMTNISKISRHKKLIESKDFGNYTIHSKSFSLYEPQNNLINLEKEKNSRKTEEERGNRFLQKYMEKHSIRKGKYCLVNSRFQTEDIQKYIYYVMCLILGTGNIHIVSFEDYTCLKI